MPKIFEPLIPPESNDSPMNEEFTPKIGEAGEVKTLLEWIAPSRPYRRKDRSYYTTIAVLVVLFILIAILIREFLLIGVLLSLAFVAYVLAFVPPDDIKYKISTQGVTIGDHFHFWHELESFWFKEKEGHQVLFVQTRIRFPGQLMLVLKDTNIEGIKKEVAKFLPFHEIPRETMMDRWSESLQKHFPLEKTHS